MPAGSMIAHVASKSPELPLDRDDVVSIMGALFDIRAGVDTILFVLTEEDDGEEEEEADS
jgi:hypothetical protein